MSDEKGPKVETKKIDPEYLKAIKESAVGWNNNQKEAIELLISACIIGQKNGIYTLQDAGDIANAIDILSPENI